MMAETPVRWYHGVPLVLVLLFFVLGPFGLPLLWRSPAFSRAGKYLCTFLVLAWTGLLIWKMSAMTIQLMGTIENYADY